MVCDVVWAAVYRAYAIRPYNFRKTKIVRIFPNTRKNISDLRKTMSDVGKITSDIIRTASDLFPPFANA